MYKIYLSVSAAIGVSQEIRIYYNQHATAFIVNSSWMHDDTILYKLIYFYYMYLLYLASATKLA
jgi:hypothetical protein